MLNEIGKFGYKFLNTVVEQFGPIEAIRMNMKTFECPKKKKTENPTHRIMMKFQAGICFWNTVMYKNELLFKDIAVQKGDTFE